MSNEQRLNEAQADALRDLVGTFGVEGFVLIGAAALQLHLDAHIRPTEDLDIGIATTMEEAGRRLAGIPGWRRHDKREHEWHSASGAHVDALPVSDDDLAKGFVTFPSGPSKMSVVGFRHVFARAKPVEVMPGLVVTVADLLTLSLLKAISYVASPLRREKDMADFAVILQNYVDQTEERRFGTEVTAAGVGFDASPAFLLGRDLAEVCDAREAEALASLLNVLDADVGSGEARAAILAGISDRQVATLDPLVTALRLGLASDGGKSGSNQT